MILVDTSVWIDHFRTSEPQLGELLLSCKVMAHPFVIGELACGNLSNRSKVLALLHDLPNAPLATDAEVLFYIGRNGLMGKGIGYIDAHLLASVALTGYARLWTRDKRLYSIAKSLHLAFFDSVIDEKRD